MNLLNRLRSTGWKTRLFLSLVLLLTIGVAVFDWNWLRPTLERHLTERSGRSVVIGDLHLSIGLSLEPTVRLRGVRIANAPWADTKKPFAVAGEAAFTFALSSLTERRPIVSRLLLIDADIDLERLADGSRNWRLRNPDDRGPGRFKFITLEAHRSKVRFLHRGVELDLHTAASPLDKPSTIEASPEPLVSRIDFSGTWRGAAFKGMADAPLVLSLMESGHAFALKGHAITGGNRLEVEGLVTDLFKLTAVDAKLHLKGPSLASLHPFVPADLPATLAYSATAHLKKEDQDYRFTDLHTRLGRSDMSGEFTYEGQRERPFLQATLKSESIDLAELLKGAGQGGAARQSELSFEALREADAQVSLQVSSVAVPALPALKALRLTARLENGELKVKPLQFNLASGQASGTLTLDARPAQPAARLEASARHWRVEHLLPDQADSARVTGPVNLQLELSAQGGSVVSLLHSLSGTATARMTDGSISDVLDAKLALNGGKLLRASLGEPRQIAIECGAIDLRFDKGRGKSTRLVLHTANTEVIGTAAVDLHDDGFVVSLDPRPKKTAVLALGQSIRVEGWFTGVKTRLAEPLERPATAACPR